MRNGAENAEKSKRSMLNPCRVFFMGRQYTPTTEIAKKEQEANVRPAPYGTSEQF
jgi:hypothetical protein